MKILILMLVICLVFPCVSPHSLRACDVSTFIAMVKAQREKERAVPKIPQETDVVILHSEESRYLVEGITALFESKHPGLHAFSKVSREISSKEPTPRTTNQHPDILLTDSLTDRDFQQHFSQADYAIEIAEDDLVLIFGGSGKHKEELKTLSTAEILQDPKLTRAIPNLKDTAITLSSEATWDAMDEAAFHPEQKIERCTSSMEIIEKIVKGEADYAFMFRSVARTFTMLTKELSTQARAASKITYSVSVHKDSKGKKAGNLWVDTVLRTDGYYKIKATGFRPLPGGRIRFCPGRNTTN